jgi:uncharacterized protein (TIGR03435 family)
MNRAIIGTVLLVGIVPVGIAQTPEPRPKFEAVDVHVSANRNNPFLRVSPVRGGRYELKLATMVDLIRLAYGFDPDKILGGPNWLEMDRFDLVGKVPPNSTPETQKVMLQAALEDRFRLVTHRDTKPLPTYALTVGKKPQLKESSGSEEPGCKPQTTSAALPPEPGVPRLMMATANGQPMTITLGPGMTIQYACRNMTMAAFAAGLRGMIGNSISSNVADETGLKGNWNFDLKYSMPIIGPVGDTGNKITIFEAVDKQLGLKLAEKPVPTPVIVVDSADQKPSPNPPGVAEALPPLAAATEFEVATIRPTDPDMRMSRFMMQPGGQLVAEGMPLRFLLGRAFNTNNNEQLADVADAVVSQRYDIHAKTSADATAAGPIDPDTLAPMMLSLLVERFNLKYHTEERPVIAYSLVAAKPKMKKADPASRTSCKNVNAPPGAPPLSRGLTCQNIAMAQFAERLQNMTPELSWPVEDKTGLEGGWDFTLSFTMGMPVALAGLGAPPPPPPPPGAPGGEARTGLAGASDPSGGYTIFEALEKQLGLKLEKQKRPMSVIVVDHIDSKPTEN